MGRKRGKGGAKKETMRPREIGGRLGQLGLLRVFVFNISIHVGRDTMAVCSLIRSVCPTPSCFSSAVLSTPVSQIVLEREKALGMVSRARAVELRAALLDPSFKLTRGGEESGERSEDTAIAVRSFLQRSSDEALCVSPLRLRERTCISRRLANEGQAPLTFLIPPATDNAIFHLLHDLSLFFPRFFRASRMSNRKEGSTGTRSSLVVEEDGRQTNAREGTSIVSSTLLRVFRQMISLSFQRSRGLQRFDEK